MKDVVGSDLSVGDTVVTNVSGYTNRLRILTIEGFTTQKIKLNDGSIKFPEQVCKVFEQE